MNWDTESRPAPGTVFDKMHAALDPLNTAALPLDMYVQRTTSPYRQVLASTQDPPKVKPPTPAKRVAWSAA